MQIFLFVNKDGRGMLKIKIIENEHEKFNAFLKIRTLTKWTFQENYATRDLCSVNNMKPE